MDDAELLDAAREVDRWRGRPAAYQIARVLGVDMRQASRLADVLHAEKAAGPADRDERDT